MLKGDDIFLRTAVSCTVRLRPQGLTTEGSNIQCTVTTSEWLCWYCELQMVVFPPTGCLIFVHIYCGFPLLSALMLNCRSKRMITRLCQRDWLVVWALTPTTMRSALILSDLYWCFSILLGLWKLLLRMVREPVCLTDIPYWLGVWGKPRCLDMDSDLYICALTYILVHMHTWTHLHTHVHMHAWTQTHTHTYVYMHGHTHMYACIHGHTHICIHARRNPETNTHP